MTVVRARVNEDDSPLDIIEHLVVANDWVFERPNDQEIAIQVPGRWCDYSIYFAWNSSANAVHFSLAVDNRVPPEKASPMSELLALANEKLWAGHFAVWQDEGLLTYRHALMLRGSAGPTVEQIEDVVENAIYETERFYPAFQYVMWGGKPPKDALAAAMIDTVGEA
jgi:hypothetical protein